MSSISEHLETLKTAIYGNEMRTAIVGAIEILNNALSSGDQGTGSGGNDTAECTGATEEQLKQIQSNTNAIAKLEAEATASIKGIENRLTVLENAGGNTGENTGTTSTTPNTICTFNEAYVAWCNGEKFPVTFFGNSTFYGTNTSGDGYTFCDILQALLRQECGANATIYKVASPGATSTHAVGTFNTYFGADGDYADTKMIGIGYGINERLTCTTYDEYYHTVYNNLKTLINKCFNSNIQPFLLTSQATMECGVQTTLASTYPLRDSTTINVCANTAKKDLAREYNIPLLDLNKYTSLFMYNSNVDINDIISDRLHFGDIGHKYEAGYLFYEMVSRVIPINSDKKQVISYIDQHIKNAVPEDKLSFGGDFKVFAHYSKSDTTDTKIFDAYIFIEDAPATLQAYKNDGGSTYIKIDDIAYPMVTNMLDLGELELGLHHLEVYTGESVSVNFNAFVLNDKDYTSEMLIPVTDIALNIGNGEMYVGDTLQLIATISPENASNKKIKWSTNNANCLVNSSGLVTALKTGESIITATTVDGGKQASCVVNITEQLLEQYDSTSLSGAQGGFSLDDGTVPVVLMFDYDPDTRNTALSGKSLVKMFIPTMAKSGTLTIGKVNLNEYGSNNMTVIEPKEYNITTTSNVEINLKDFILGENETLCISSTTDTAVPCYTGSVTDYMGKMMMSSTFKKGSQSSLGFKCIVYYEAEQEG